MPIAPPTSNRCTGWCCATLLACCLMAPLAAVDPTQRPLIDLTAANAVEKLVPNDAAQVTVARDAAGITLTIAHGGNGYPGITIKPDGADTWDLSKCGHVAVTVTNTGKDKIGVCLRVDNAGDWKANPWNGENLYLAPGKTGTAVVHFGYSWGKKGYALDPAKVSQVLVFLGNPKETQSFRIESITTGGEPGEAPPVPADQVRMVPKGGVILGAGATPLESKQIEAKGVEAALGGEPTAQSVRITAAAGAAGSATVKPLVGRWDLRECLEVRVKLRNDGQAPVRAKVKLDSAGGASDAVAGEIAPGASSELVIPFAAAKIWDGSKDSGTKLASDAAGPVVVSVEKGEAARSLVVEGITAGMPATATPEWIGTRPPVPGEWTRSWGDEFDGAAIDESKWNIYTANYWDKRTHFTKDDIILGNGMVKLHYEKKTGFHNDDPKGKETDYACGFLDSYGKWTQKYGYFEARLKVPTAPGLWPAFWMMPDRGVAAGEQWKRASTSDGGMEFDIMEHLTRWGPYRYNIAMHWDGYGKEHKATGSSNVYVAPDKDGFLIVGLLWEPGKLTYYGNGSPVVRYENERVSNVQAYPIFNVVSGGWDNNALDDAQLPADLTIDWIRCWQRKDLAEAAPAATDAAK